MLILNLNILNEFGVRTADVAAESERERECAGREEGARVACDRVETNVEFWQPIVTD